MKLRLGFLASHGGSSMQAIHAAIQAGQLQAQAQIVISNNSQSDALAFARAAALPAYHLSVKTEQTAERLDRRMRDLLLAHEVQLVILSGYMKKLGPQTLSTYKDRILNIHPALLPKYGLIRNFRDSENREWNPQKERSPVAAGSCVFAS